MKNMSVKKIVAMIVGAAAVLAVAAVAAVLALRVDSAEAQQIALDTVGGGEIVSQEGSSEGLWNEYSYEIINVVRHRNQRLRLRHRAGERQQPVSPGLNRRRLLHPEGAFCIMAE